MKNAIAKPLLNIMPFTLVILAQFCAWICYTEALFEMKLTHRKAEVKGIIEEVISNMTDEEDNGDGDADNESEEEADENNDH